MYSDMMRLVSSYPEKFTLWIYSVLSIEKKFSAKALSYGLSRLDIDGVMPYDCVRLKVCLRCVLKSLVTVELHLCSDFFFPFCSFNRSEDQFYTLLFIHFVCNNDQFLTFQYNTIFEFCFARFRIFSV